MEHILKHFKLNDEREDFDTVIGNIDDSVEFKGTNLWILVFAIFIASLGLNVNSTAVVIGAMLVSPLMGPIIGLGMGMAINDLALLKKALFNYAFAAVVGLVASTIFFALSPLKDASTEVLARTSPNVYDVLIALFGGFAGILAVSSKKKANVIPGVAIATALMPPLCTAGYGIANLNVSYISGALYLFVINTVFIALATLITARFLGFPFKHLPEEKDEVFAKRIVWGVVLITLIPSIYFAYDIVQQNRFKARANKFVAAEGVFANDYLLKKDIDAKKATITLTYGGEYIGETAIEALRAKLPAYELGKAKLEIRQGFSYLRAEADGEDDQTKHLAELLKERDAQVQALKNKVDAANANAALGRQVFEELRTQYSTIASCVIQPVANHQTDETREVWLVIITSRLTLGEDERKKIESWLKVRLKTEDVTLLFRTAEISKTSEPR